MAHDTYNLIQSRYDDIAKHSGNPAKQHQKEEGIARAFGYSAEELNTLPEKTNLGLSCGNPMGFANLREVS